MEYFTLSFVVGSMKNSSIANSNGCDNNQLTWVHGSTRGPEAGNRHGWKYSSTWYT